MSSRTGKKKSKAVDRSTAWSDWAWDAENSRYYRTRCDVDGSYLYDIASDPTQTITQQTPRGETGSNPAGQYTTEAAAAVPTGTYYSNDSYGYQTPSSSAEVSLLSDQLQRSKISFNDQPQVAHSTSYDYASSGSSTSVGYGGAQPIDVPVSLARATSSGRREYSASAPTGGYISNWKGNTNESASGYFPEESPGFIPGTYDERQANWDYRHAPVENTSYAAGSQAGTSNSSSTDYTLSSFGAQPSSEGNEQGGSGTVTPRIHKEIKGTKGSVEKLDSRFRIQSSKHFKPGHIFKVLWSEPKGETRPDTTAVTKETLQEIKHGEKVYSSIRRFAIVATDHGHSQCIPILTYQGQGATKWGVNPDDHAIIYSGEKPPPNDEGLTKRPIRMISKTPRDKLDRASRINYTKIYTVEHNVKVLFIGHVASASERDFATDFDNAWSKKRQIGGIYQN